MRECCIHDTGTALNCIFPLKMAEVPGQEEFRDAIKLPLNCIFPSRWPKCLAKKNLEMPLNCIFSPPDGRSAWPSEGPALLPGILAGAPPGGRQAGGAGAAGGAAGHPRQAQRGQKQPPQHAPQETRCHRFTSAW